MHALVRKPFDSLSYRMIEHRLEQAGIQINGPNPWDIQVLDQRLYLYLAAMKMAGNGALAFGDSYIEGWWECRDLSALICKLLQSEPYKQGRGIGNVQTPEQARAMAEGHYDIPFDLFKVMLDPLLFYSCAYWRAGAKSLEEAQRAKARWVCAKLHLQKGQRILDVGCGYGGLAYIAATEFDVEVYGITNSENHARIARRRCEGLPVRIFRRDYRDLPDLQFDHIVSVGQFEHVGPQNYRTWMQGAARRLKPEGFILLHTIGRDGSGSGTNPWVDKHIFPGGVIPKLEQILEAANGIFVPEDLENFGPDYDTTLMAWHRNFTSHWLKLRNDPAHKGFFDERFRRKWNFYLLSCAGAFRARKLQLWHLILSAKNPGGYVRPAFRKDDR